MGVVTRELCWFDKTDWQTLFAWQNTLAKVVKRRSYDFPKIIQAKLNKNQWNINEFSGKHWWYWTNKLAHHIYYKITWYYRVTLHLYGFLPKNFPNINLPFHYFWEKVLKWEKQRMISYTYFKHFLRSFTLNNRYS